MPTPSATRVTTHTSPSTNRRIADQLAASLAYHALHPERIPARLRQLDQEWDVERALETGSASLSLAGLTFSLLTGRRRWLLLPLAVQSFFLQHALQGWCPPLPVFRSLGFRTQYEIEQERHALKSLRGDFQNAPSSPEAAQQAVRA